MKLPFSTYFDPIAADAQVVLDVAVEWERGNAKLRVDDVYESTGKVSLIRHCAPFWKELAGMIVDEAEKCPRLLARAVEQDVFEREAA